MTKFEYTWDLKTMVRFAYLKSFANFVFGSKPL